VKNSSLIKLKPLFQFLLISCLLFVFSELTAQKTVYIPEEWGRRGIPYSMDRSFQSENFVLFWGEKAGTNPTLAPTDIRFTPSVVAATLESVYAFFMNEIKLIPADKPNISKYKLIIVLNETWNPLANGTAIFTGWAFGGSYDSRIGAMWIHPRATNRFTLAHEFTHMMQNMAWIEYPGHGFINNDYVGSFWETHANFIALKDSPNQVESTDPARFLSTQHFYWSSARHHYTNWLFLQHIEDEDGMELINRMWRESNIGEHPLQTYKRIKGTDQSGLNDQFGYYAMKNVAFDYSNGDEIRYAVNSRVDKRYITRRFTVLSEINRYKGRYAVPHILAPQDYGYNLVRIYPAAGNTDKKFSITFKGHGNSPSGGAGWRSGFVFIKNNGTVRYSQLFRDGFEAEMPYEADDKEIYLVVTAAPSVHHNYAWEPGWPKIYRFPWEIRLTGAVPEGYQPDPNAQYKTVPGSPHHNGGGFVAATATVASGVYVGPNAVVTGTANVSGSARITGQAVVMDNARVSGNAIIDGYAVVGGNAAVTENAKVGEYARVNNGSNIQGSAMIKGSASVFNSTIGGLAVVKDNASLWGANLAGDIVVGGDAEGFGECGTGIYLQIFNLGNRGCDGLLNHSLNSDINQNYIPFTDEEMGLTTGVDDIFGKLLRPYTLRGDSHTQSITIDQTDESDHIVRIITFNITGRQENIRVFSSSERQITIPSGNSPVCFLQIFTSKGGIYTEKVLLFQ
jgi:carbonic anhydrase/acetyltransferase-like protein (isoleucine patch superfamily)